MQKAGDKVLEINWQKLIVSPFFRKHVFLIFCKLCIKNGRFNVTFLQSTNEYLFENTRSFVKVNIDASDYKVRKILYVRFYPENGDAENYVFDACRKRFKR